MTAAVADLLRAARALIAREEQWTPTAPARTGRAVAVHPLDPTAVRFSLRGTLLRAAGSSESDAAWDARAALDAAVPGGDAADWEARPGRTHAEILAAFDKAIALEGGDAGGEDVDRAAAAMLRAARARIADPADWFPGLSSAVDATGAPAHPWRPEAVRWSAFGTLQTVTASGRAATRALEALTDIAESDVYDWNAAPGRTHAEVLAVFDAAVAALAPEDGPSTGAAP